MMEYAGAEKDAYVGRYLREFDRQIEGADLRSALQGAEAIFDRGESEDPEDDARAEAECWRDPA